MSQDILNMETIEQLKMVMGDDAAVVITDLIDTLQESGSEQVEIMKDALADEDLETIKRAAHTLKGSSGNMGATALSGVCVEIEEMAAAEDLQGLRDLLALLTRQFEQTMVAMRKIEF